MSELTSTPTPPPPVYVRPAPFSATVMENFLHPKGVGSLPDPSGEGWAGSLQAHRFMRFQVALENGTITAATFGTYGCAPAIAAGSFLTQWVKGKTVEAAQALTSDELTTLLGGLPEARRFVADLAVDALRAALLSATVGHGKAPAPVPDKAKLPMPRAPLPAELHGKTPAKVPPKPAIPPAPKPAPGLHSRVAYQPPAIPGLPTVKPIPAPGAPPPPVLAPAAAHGNVKPPAAKPATTKTTTPSTATSSSAPSASDTPPSTSKSS